VQNYHQKCQNEIYSFISCGLFNDAVGSSDYIVSNDRMNSDLERTWKDAIVVEFKVLSRHLPGETE
jgi:hypothetical protein